MTTLSLKCRRAIRQLVSPGHLHDRTAVAVIPGWSYPHAEGEGYYYQTPGGARVNHPNAYRKAWGKPVYVCSSYRIVIGAECLAALGLESK